MFQSAGLLFGATVDSQQASPRRREQRWEHDDVVLAEALQHGERLLQPASPLPPQEGWARASSSKLTSTRPSAAEITP